MNFISCPTLGIYASKKSVRATYIDFWEQLVCRVPFVCDRLFSYMEQVVFQTSKTRRHLCQIAPTENPTHTHILSNGWHLQTVASPQDFASKFLQHVEDALGGIPIIAAFESRGINEYDIPLGYANFPNFLSHRRLTREQFDMLLGQVPQTSVATDDAPPPVESPPPPVVDIDYGDLEESQEWVDRLLNFG